MVELADERFQRHLAVGQGPMEPVRKMERTE